VDKAIMLEKHQCASDRRNIIVAILAVIRQWRQYEQMLQKSSDIKKWLSEEWLDQFIKDWNVNRTINGNKIKRKYLLMYILSIANEIRNSPDITTVDRLSNHIKNKKCSAKEGSKVISFSSKIAFIINPDFFVPYDKFGVAGLFGTKKPSNYANYIEEFNFQYKNYENLINRECNKSWVNDLIAELGLPNNLNNSIAFKRKVYDMILMICGGRPIF
jgi:hypothetical protein